MIVPRLHGVLDVTHERMGGTLLGCVLVHVVVNINPTSVQELETSLVEALAFELGGDVDFEVMRLDEEMRCMLSILRLQRRGFV